jgi:hypothetical protein
LRVIGYHAVVTRPNNYRLHAAKELVHGGCADLLDLWMLAAVPSEFWQGRLEQFAGSLARHLLQGFAKLSRVAFFDLNYQQIAV